jgi:hypothetical protein
VLSVVCQSAHGPDRRPLVARVIPWVPTRPWVVSVPVPLRYGLAVSQELTAQVHTSIRTTIGQYDVPQAHCHRGLGTLYAKLGQREQARAALSTAIELYRTMEMTFWLPQAEAALAQMALDLAAAPPGPSRPTPCSPNAPLLHA